MSERGLEFEKNIVGWLAHSTSGRREISSWWIAGVLEHSGADKYIELVLKHGPGSAAARLRDLLHTGSIEALDVETAIRWSQAAPAVDDSYMLEVARGYLRQRCHVIHAEQAVMASEVWDDKLLSAADLELRQRLAKLAPRDTAESNGFTPAGVALAFSAERQEDLFRIPGYVGRIFWGRLTRGSLVCVQAQPKTGKSAVLARMTTAAVRYGNRVRHISVGDQDQFESAARVVSCEQQRNGEPYEQKFRGVPCCNHAKAGCPKQEFADGGYAPLDPPVGAQYLEETEVPAILQAFPSFKPCTLCRGTPDYSPGYWWETATDDPITDHEATRIVEAMAACGEYGKLDTLFFPARKLTVAMLEAMLIEARDAGAPIDVLVVDYADMMGLDLQGGKSAKWEALQYMWEALRALAATYDCLILTATQGNRAGGDMTTQNSTTAAGTRASIDNCTLVVALNQTPAERARGILRVSEVAARKRAFAPEHQAECLSRMDIQDPFYDSWHKWVKTDKKESK